MYTYRRAGLDLPSQEKLLPVILVVSSAFHHYHERAAEQLKEVTASGGFDTVGHGEMFVMEFFHEMACRLID